MPEGTRKPRLLVVDDEPLLIKAIKRALRSKVDVVGATDGDEALRLLAEDDFDVILAEIYVFGRDGQCFVHTLEQTLPGWLPRLIVASGGRHIKEAQRLGDEHGCPLLFKPVDPTALVELVTRYCAERKPPRKLPPRPTR